jgi:hypothetical protein
MRSFTKIHVEPSSEIEFERDNSSTLDVSTSKDLASLTAEVSCQIETLSPIARFVCPELRGFEWSL